MLNHPNKKISCLVLSVCLLLPSSSMAKARDYVMATTGAFFAAAGITLIIKSGKTKPQQQTKLEIKAWNPMNAPQVEYDPLRR